MTHLNLPDIGIVPILNMNSNVIGFSNTGGKKRKAFIQYIRMELKNGNFKMKKNGSKGIRGYFHDILDQNGCLTFNQLFIH